MRILLALATVAFLNTPALADGDPAAGAKKAETCLGCHGIANYDNAYPTYNVPKLGGQHVQYLTDALKSYQNGARAHDTMHAQAATLSDQDIADIAAYFSSLGAADAQPAAAAPAVPEKVATCASCHGPSGVSSVPMYPILAGQYQSYLLHALQAYKTGSRSNAVMATFAGQLSDQDIKQLATWFARQQGPLQVLPRE